MGVATAAAATSCGSFCEGGFIRNVIGSTSGLCEGKCEPSKCLAGNTCVDNRCKGLCTSHLDCLTTQDCSPAIEDDTQHPIHVCQDNGKAPRGSRCPLGNECGAVSACANGSACNFAQCGGESCTPDTGLCVGEFSCNLGECPDQTRCTVPGCSTDHCKPLFCASSGPGDADAYCTLLDCHADADCAGGYACVPRTDPHGICDAIPPKGNNSYCGKTNDPCVSRDALTAGGATFSEGSTCLLRNRCVPRGPCAPCSSDIDCSVIPGQHCTTVGAETVCTQDCSVDSDCQPDHRCDKGACIPRFGACTGAGGFCEPCRTELDCGATACIDLQAGEGFCFDIRHPPTCKTSADCPLTPDGHHGQCLNEEVGLTATERGYGRCNPPLNTATNRSSCWCTGEGAPCRRDVECCSGTCIGGSFTSDIRKAKTGKCG